MINVLVIKHPEPYNPGPEYNLVNNDWDGEPILYGTNVTYECAGGTKFEDDLYKQELVSKSTLDGTSWIEPDGGWQKCVES